MTEIAETQKLPRMINRRLAGIVACFKTVLFITLLQASPSHAQTALEMRCQQVARAEVRPSDGYIAFPDNFLSGVCWGSLGAISQAIRFTDKNKTGCSAFARRRIETASICIDFHRICGPASRRSPQEVG